MAGEVQVNCARLLLLLRFIVSPQVSRPFRAQWQVAARAYLFFMRTNIETITNFIREPENLHFQLNIFVTFTIIRQSIKKTKNLQKNN